MCSFRSFITAYVNVWEVGIAEIVFGDRAVAVWLLRRAVNRFAAGEDEAGEFAMYGGFEHVRHAENVHAR